jgi:hypothetical protein
LCVIGFQSPLQGIYLGIEDKASFLVLSRLVGVEMIFLVEMKMNTAGDEATLTPVGVSARLLKCKATKIAKGCAFQWEEYSEE